jgi:hypothetical protein
MGSSHPRNSTRAGKARSAKSLPRSRRTPVTPKRPSKLRTASDGRETHDDDLPVTELRELRSKLKRAMSTAIVVGYALSGQNVMVDSDAADLLRLYVSDELDRQIERIDILLGEPPRDERVEDDGGEV